MRNNPMSLSHQITVLLRVVCEPYPEHLAPAARYVVAQPLLRSRVMQIGWREL